jgi:hypothetical protein
MLPPCSLQKPGVSQLDRLTDLVLVGIFKRPEMDERRA